MTLTEKQREVLERGAEGHCYRGVWRWNRGHEPVTREVNALMKRGLLDGIYFSGGKAAANATDAGRALIGKAR